MDIQEIRRKIQEQCDSTERIFLDLGDKFPSLLNKQSGSIENMHELFSSLGRENETSLGSESEFFSGFSGKYGQLFEVLNEKINDLEDVNHHVKEIKMYSEEMELIALNAMVISIKSGEKGRAFSTITDNLKRLSTDMIIYSNKLIDEENSLLEQIKSVKDTFQNIIGKQNMLATLSERGGSDVRDMITGVNSPLSEMSELSGLVNAPIQKAMEGLQIQDIVRQSLDHVQTCLSEISNPNVHDDGSDEQLDCISYNLELLQLAHSVLTDIDKNIDKSIEIFDGNWSNVRQILEQVESERKNFISRFLDESSVNLESIPKKLQLIIMRFQEILDNFNSYRSVQKNLVRLCQSITEKARTMYSVFENIRPVVSRLHHVRILQGIEVNKNSAIESVRDSVNDMDNLISSANTAIDEMRNVLDGFISEINKMLGDFMVSITKDNEGMKKLHEKKKSFFNSLRDAQDQTAALFHSFVVFPESFNDQCSEVAVDIAELTKIINFFKSTISSLDVERDALQTRRDNLLSERGLDSWTIRDSKFRDVIKKFTISAHKEVAGKIGGFSVNKQGASEGDITLF